jgi:hypothetical protein
MRRILRFTKHLVGAMLKGFLESAIAATNRVTVSTPAVVE